MRFINVTFESSALVVMAGAHVTITGSTFSQSAESSGISLYGHGGGTSIQLGNSSISGGMQGIAMQSRAVLEAQQVTISGAAGLRDRAVEPSYSSAAELATRSSENNQDLECCEFMYGIRVEDAIGNVTGCSITDCARGGVVFLGLDATGVVNDCTFLRNKIGVLAAEEASVNLRGCHTVESGHGAVVRSSACLDCAECSSEKDSVGLHCSGGSSLTALKLSVMEARVSGCVIESEAMASFTDCSVAGSGAKGIVAMQRAQLSLQGCSVSQAKSTCVEVSGSATGKLAGCALVNSRQGVSSTGHGTELHAHRLCFNNMQLSAA
ncbi:MAG: hypothetical protein HC767_01320, partial [Akkermansiaceae bacterium]|nr:hypothetical protein [Akkermansiaceae bacterium]